MNTKTIYDYVVVGLGQTGLSCARFLSKKGYHIAVTDSRPNPPGKEALSQEFPQVKQSLGQLDQPLLMQAKQILLSPGVSMAQPAIQASKAAGISVIGDIELF